MYDLEELLGMHRGALVEEATIFGFGKDRVLVSFAHMKFQN